MNQTYPDGYWLRVILGGFIVGTIAGFVPLITGIIKKRVLFGVAGFIGCVVGGVILGLILAVPIAAVFTLIIALKKTEENFQLPPAPPNFNRPTAEFGDREKGETK